MKIFTKLKNMAKFLYLDWEGIGYYWGSLKLSYYRLPFQIVKNNIRHSFLPLAQPQNYSVPLSEYLNHWQLVLEYTFECFMNCIFCYTKKYLLDPRL